MNIKSVFNWRVKILLKIILSRLPFRYRLWQALDLFKHGYMDVPSYACKIFENHYNLYRQNAEKQESFVVMELGPGDTLFSSLIANSYGASKSYLIDVGNFARSDIEPYLQMAKYLKEKGKQPVELEGVSKVGDVLSLCNAQYEIDGLASLRKIPSNSVDFIFSQAVLEHVRKDDFSLMMVELKRVLRAGGVCSHRIDLKDHLGGGLNNLRFNESTWESSFMSSSGFYTNRIRYSAMLDLFKGAGFAIEVVNVDRWGSLPVDKAKLDREFRDLSDEELNVSGFDVLLSS